MLIIELNNIHEFNVLRYILWIFSKKQVFLIGVLYHAYALGLLPITTKYGKIIHHQTISNIFLVP